MALGLPEGLEDVGIEVRRELEDDARGRGEMPKEEIRRRVPCSNEIRQFFHCSLCIEELPAGESPQGYRRLDVGWTKLGLQVWCTRHDANVVHVDFEGAKHAANTNRLKSEEVR